MKQQGITILGATGSIGSNTLDVVAAHPERFRVIALTAHSQVDKLFEQCCRFHPQLAVVGTAEHAVRLRDRLATAGVRVAVLHGEDAVVQAACHADADMVMAAIVGAAGLRPTLAAAALGKRILLANKESLVVAGELFMQTVRSSGAELLPVDSEHNALFQSLPATYRGDLDSHGIDELILTASGGPFRTRQGSLHDVTPADACNHPNWVMGRKISVDSASLMNKGLEVIEARWLFNAPPDRIKVIVHPQSVIHSMVRYKDGSVMAQLGTPDMRTPIAYAMSWPQRMSAPVKPLDFAQLSGLTFEAPDLQRFPCLQMAFDALHAGGAAPAVLNAANEVAVEAFLQARIRFTDIPALVARSLDELDLSAADSLDALLERDAAVRTRVMQWIAS